MSWGERSCLRPCRYLESCNHGECKCECHGYVWDGKTEPDSIISEKNYNKNFSEPSENQKKVSLGMRRYWMRRKKGRDK